jgi:hypothetical protein
MRGWFSKGRGISLRMSLLAASVGQAYTAGRAPSPHGASCSRTGRIRGRARSQKKTGDAGARDAARTESVL